MNTKSRTQPREALGTDNGKYYTNAHKHTMHCEIIHKSLTQFRAQELHFSDDVSTYRLLRLFRLLCCSFVIATASIRLTWADKFVRMSCCTLLKNVYSLKNPPKNIIKSHLIFYCFLLSVVEDDYCCAAHNFSSAERGWSLLSRNIYIEIKSLVSVSSIGILLWVLPSKTMKVHIF